MSGRYFTYRGLDELRRDAERMQLDLNFEESYDAVAQPVRVAGRRVGNALAIHPMEGCDGTEDGAPGVLTRRRWMRFAAGGAKLLWGEATAVTHDGRANPRQLHLHAGNAGAFAQLVADTRAEHRRTFGRDDDLLVGLQLTHSGRYSHPRPVLAFPHPVLDPFTVADKRSGERVTGDYPKLSDGGLEALEDAYAEAARLAFDAGFDFVDLKQCHGYLLNELLAGRNRPGAYGGSFENRTRFARNTIGKIRHLAGAGVMIAARISAFDGIPYRAERIDAAGEPVDVPKPYRLGFGVDETDPTRDDPAEPEALAALLSSLDVRLLNVTLGCPYRNPHIGRPYERASEGSYASPEHPLIGVARHVRIAARLQKRCPECAIVGTGYSWLQRFMVSAAEATVREGKAAFVGFGRGALAYPEFARDALEHGALERKRVCLTVSFCTDLMRAKHNAEGQFPTGCVPRDPLYAGVYKVMTAARKEPEHPSQAEAEERT